MGRQGDGGKGIALLHRGKWGPIFSISRGRKSRGHDANSLRANLQQSGNEAGNEYRCFALEHGQTENFYITGMAPLVGEDSIVHHIVLFKQPKSDLKADYDPAVGYDCMDSFSLFEGMLGGWAQGRHRLSSRQITAFW